ncbi:MAG: hypothetical protein HND56_06255 [Pseudomonadota bacterium]|nr:MAG: hypothetical protein HND56_06255 [Pseudomonadota bacterium]
MDEIAYPANLSRSEIKSPDVYMAYKLCVHMLIMALAFNGIAFVISFWHVKYHLFPFLMESDFDENLLETFQYCFNFGVLPLLLALPFYFFWFGWNMDFSQNNYIRHFGQPKKKQTLYQDITLTDVCRYFILMGIMFWLMVSPDVILIGGFGDIYRAAQSFVAQTAIVFVIYLLGSIAYVGAIVFFFKAYLFLAYCAFCYFHKN